MGLDLCRPRRVRASIAWGKLGARSQGGFRCYLMASSHSCWLLLCCVPDLAGGALYRSYPPVVHMHGSTCICPGVAPRAHSLCLAVWLAHGLVMLRNPLVPKSHPLCLIR